MTKILWISPKRRENRRSKVLNHQWWKKWAFVGESSVFVTILGRGDLESHPTWPWYRTMVRKSLDGGVPSKLRAPIGYPKKCCYLQIIHVIFGSTPSSELGVSLRNTPYPLVI
jgi:hypothetical protein